jgi:transcription-repair coupling factor (superfamily II helicase)
MSARDLSIISTAPSNRVPIESEVIRFNAKSIQKAVRYELDRGGQIFFVHNKIDNINEFGKWLENLVPEASIKIAHSKIEGKKLETIMLEFIENKFDILLSTTIIESGLDVPNANTIFINNSHHFGLSDLHQMRGRVGRSNKRAFCYFITPEISSLTSEAKKRIDAIGQYSELGAGFNIAMKDLEIRGAGDLLGGEQSGFINDIGFETYHKILNEAVEELKNTEFKKLFKENEKDNYFIKDVVIDTDFEILFPNSFISQVNERLKLYNKLSQLKDESELNKFRNELEDKYGNIPLESENLLKSIKLKWTAQKLGFEKIVIKRNKMLCYFISDNSNKYFDSNVFKDIIKNISKFEDCELKEKNKLYIIFDNVKSIDHALLNLDRFQFIDD